MWNFSPKGRPHRKVGNLLIRPYTSKFNERFERWDKILVSKYKKGQIINSKGKKIFVDSIRAAQTFDIQPGIQIRLSGKKGGKWSLTNEERLLIKEVNLWLKKYIKKDILTLEDVT